MPFLFQKFSNNTLLVLINIILTGGLIPDSTSVMGAIEFNNLQFSYPMRPNVPVFQDLNLSVEAGKVMAVVGPSGSGKSSLGSLLLRYYDPTSGESPKRNPSHRTHYLYSSDNTLLHLKSDKLIAIIMACSILCIVELCFLSYDHISAQNSTRALLHKKVWSRTRQKIKRKLCISQSVAYMHSKICVWSFDCLLIAYFMQRDPG